MAKGKEQAPLEKAPEGGLKVKSQLSRGHKWVVATMSRNVPSTGSILALVS